MAVVTESHMLIIKTHTSRKSPASETDIALMVCRETINGNAEVASQNELILVPADVEYRIAVHIIHYQSLYAVLLECDRSMH